MTATIRSVRAALDLHPDLGRHIATIKISTRRKSLGMSIRPGDSGITLHVPAAHTPADVVATLAENRHRIASMLHKARRTVPAIPVKELVNGASFLWLGQNNRLRLVDDAAEAVRHVDDHGTTTERGTWRGRWLELDRSVVRLGGAPLISWYIQEGSAWLDAQAGPLWARIAGGRRPLPAVRAADIGRSRWGVHHHKPNPADDTIRIAWQTFQLRPALVRHVLTHELVHAARPGGRAHGHEFWRAFERAEPGARQRERELHKEGATVWMGDVHPPAPR
ncbi:YgjP-like metallopeptidase domain-containing protein [Actinacidiphila sp. ITFR-21]|uniref:YgjP-like metallopeptidase domain-containing protein n=1 Tax=Actinacidiphila sp. ITFR-21 TaxID=3075199 RepID=UPI00288B50FC|nr:YgjP-like metallopeptidase domain-containing protein [Streptomyces sp. ITFR-21]WNI20145.1 DUF45 domain-containing protein [Streptomyces sp. ITFR-21]